jgi:hypothetical protein
MFTGDFHLMTEITDFEVVLVRFTGPRLPALLPLSEAYASQETLRRGCPASLWHKTILAPETRHVCAVDAMAGLKKGCRAKPACQLLRAGCFIALIARRAARAG